MSIKSEVTRINSKVTSQHSIVSNIADALNSKLGTSISKGENGTPLEQNSDTLANIQSAINSYTPSSQISTYTETIYNWSPHNITPTEISVWGFGIIQLPLENNGRIIRVLDCQHTSSDWFQTIVIDGWIGVYGDFYGNTYNLTITYEAY